MKKERKGSDDMIKYYYLLQIHLTRAYPNPLIHGFVAYAYITIIISKFIDLCITNSVYTKWKPYVIRLTGISIAAASWPQRWVGNLL